MATLAGLRSEMIARIPKLQRGCGADSVRIENGEESFTVVVAWPNGELRRRFRAHEAAGCFDAQAVKDCACNHKDEIIRAVLERRMAKARRLQAAPARFASDGS